MANVTGNISVDTKAHDAQKRETCVQFLGNDVLCKPVWFLSRK